MWRSWEKVGSVFGRSCTGSGCIDLRGFEDLRETGKFNLINYVPLSSDLVIRRWRGKQMRQSIHEMIIYYEGIYGIVDLE